MARLDNIEAVESDNWAVQASLLRGVSRTFALTIPQLPKELRNVVGNGYLLCRIVDTIEDDPGIDNDAKFSLYKEFMAVLNKRSNAAQFAARLHGALSASVPHNERELIAATPTVVELTHVLTEAQQQSLIRCTRIMCNGMHEFQVSKSLSGLKSISDMYRYCYVVAGVVGEMLTELFSQQVDEIRDNKDTMMDLAVCFGHGLQMTNILKDVWEDSDDGSCWLPRSAFGENSENLGVLIRNKDSAELANGIDELVGIAHANLKMALNYSCMIPKSQVGIRRFCLWAIGMALLTLQKIYRNPGYSNGDTVKISRRRVRAVMLSCNSVIYSNHLVRAWFDLASMGLPLADVDEVCDPVRLKSMVEAQVGQSPAVRETGLH